MGDLTEILRERQIRTVYYFHTDHFEPWSSGLNERAARGVERFEAMTRGSPLAARLSLFYCPYVPYYVASTDSGGGRVAGDQIAFGTRSAEQDQLARSVIRPLVTDERHELHLHVHHEFWTRNDSNFDNPVSCWVNKNSTPELDRQRLDLFFDCCKQVISTEIAAPFERWAFIHGNWALAGSDPLICHIDNELGMIMRHGGFGDFSFPAGRGYCDPKFPAPFTCLPVNLKRAYDEPLSAPRPVGPGNGALQPDRFFIWNSPIKANYSSIDYYSAGNRNLFKTPDRVIAEWLSRSVGFGDALFIKTHAHSMKWEYEISEPGSLIPHCYPDVVKIFDRLLQVCDRAGVEFRPVTVNQVMELLHQLDSSRAPTKLSCADLVVSKSGGASASALRPRLSAPPQEVGDGSDSQAATASPNRATDGVSAVDQDPGSGKPYVLIVEREMLTALRGWVNGDPRRLESAGRFYRRLLDGDQLLQDYEKAVLDYIIDNFPAERTGVVEIGVGYGTLSLLLAASGYEVVAFEGDPLRFEGIQFLRQTLGARAPRIAGNLQAVAGWFPDAFDRSMLSGDHRTLLVTTNIVASAAADRQEAILGEFAFFDDLVIDTTRFGICRYDPEIANRFRARIAEIYRPVTLVWRREPNEIWHFRVNQENDGASRVATREPLDAVENRTDGPLTIGFRMPLDISLFTDEFLAIQRGWMAVESATSQTDELYAHKLARGVALEPYEVILATAVARLFNRQTLIVEIGSGYGALALLLALNGFTVHAFEGDRRRIAAFRWHLTKYAACQPELADRVDLTEGFFPDAMSEAPADGSGNCVCIATNITCTYTAEHQQAILEAVKACDEFILDLGRFGQTRNAQNERDTLRDLLIWSGFTAIERLHAAGQYEYWRFRAPSRAVRAQARQATLSAAAAPPPPSAVASLTAPGERSAFPLRDEAGILYSLYGDRRLDACPVCHGRHTVALWRMPMSNLKEPIRLFGGYFNQVPTLEIPATVYCFDFCHDCESIFLNPVPATQKAQYRKTDHYIRMMQNEGEWEGYENAFDRIAQWIPTDATRMLDAACGIGQYVQVARRREPDRWQRLVGLELAEQYVQHMQAQGIEAYAFDIDADDLSLWVAPASIDFITFCEAFEHVERPLDALRKLLMALRPGGRLYFTAQRYGRGVQAAVRPGEPIYVGEKVLRELPQRLGCKLVDVTTSSMRYYVILEKLA